MQLLSETSLREDQRAYVERISSSVKALTTLLNDILDYSRLEVSKLKLEYNQFSASSLLDDIVTIYALEANKEGIELIGIVDKDVPESLNGCGDRISQILRNLVSNAIKFTSQGEITIRIEKLADSDESLYRFSVTDTGIGIPSSERDRLFQPFSQLESGMQRNHEGVGLGLVISKALTELIGGQIFVNSIEGVGSCFSVELPLQARIPLLDTETVTTTPKDIAQGIPCWVISPNANIQTCLQQIFARWSVTVLTDNSLPCEIDELPALIMSASDEALLVIDGLFGGKEITRFLRLLEDSPSRQRMVPVLLETADGCAGQEQLCKAFSHRLSRPLTYREIEALVFGVRNPDSMTEQHSDLPRGTVHSTASGHITASVLLVDDNVINREFLNIWMTKAGMDVDEVKNGVEALDACAVHSYDLILMDLHMPEMDGFQAIEAIKTTQNKNTNSRIIAITADATEETISQIKSSGFDDFLIKPVTRERLLEISIGLHANQETNLLASDYEPELKTAESPIVDEELGMRYASGNKALWQWSLKTLAHKLPLYRDALQQATETHEREELSQILHKILGAASYCGATNLLSATKQLQNKIKSDTNAEFALEHSALNTSITAFVDWVTRQKLG